MISLPVQSWALVKSAFLAYSMAAVVPVIFPSLRLAEVGAVPFKPVGAAGPSPLAMLQGISLVPCVSSLH